MNLYLITQSENRNYDSFNSAVVAAPDEEIARNMDPNGGDLGEKIDWNEPNYTWCSSPDLVSVTKIGVADESILNEVICASFNAG